MSKDSEPLTSEREVSRKLRPWQRFLLFRLLDKYPAFKAGRMSYRLFKRWRRHRPIKKAKIAFQFRKLLKQIRKGDVKVGTYSKLIGAALSYGATWLVGNFPILADTPLADGEWVNGLASLVIIGFTVWLFPANK